MEAMSPSETSPMHNTLSLRERGGVRAKITKQLSKNLRRNQTKAEIKIWRHLKNRTLAGFKFRRQCPIGPYIVDFVCFERMLVIEIDGGQHAKAGVYPHTDERKKAPPPCRGGRGGGGGGKLC